MKTKISAQGCEWVTRKVPDLNTDFRLGLSGKTGACEVRLDASYQRHPVTEPIYINSLVNSPCRSTVKTLPATVPEP